MPVPFSVVVPENEAEVAKFLSGVFGFTEVPPSLLPRAVAWKYFDPHPWWPGGRSYVLRTPDGIAAHGCVSPVRFAFGGGTVESMQVIDWAAGGLIPAAGLQIFRRCLEVSGGTLLTIGGSDDTNRILPRVKWFKRKDDLCVYARPLRPWRYFQHSAKRPRDLARLARNLQWQWFPRLARPGAWHCRRARPGEEVFSPAGDFVPMVRTRTWFDYLLRCPVVKTELVILEKAGKPNGHALLANALGSVRVADFVVGGEVSPTERSAAFSALLRYVAAQPEAAEIVAASSLRELCRAFEVCGLRHRSTSSVFLADPQALFPSDARLEINLLIGDGFYLHDPAVPFLC